MIDLKNRTKDTITCQFDRSVAGATRDLVIYDRAGERILEDLQAYAEEKIREERIAGRLSIFKNNTDFVGNSYGCHENYLVDRDVDFYYLAEQLIPFLVTRQIYTGAGKVFRSGWGQGPLILFRLRDQSLFSQGV